MATGVHRDRLELPVPFEISIDVVALARWSVIGVIGVVDVVDVVDVIEKRDGEGEP